MYQIKTHLIFKFWHSMKVFDTMKICVAERSDLYSIFTDPDSEFYQPLT